MNSILPDQLASDLKAHGIWGVVAEIPSSGQNILHINPDEVFPAASIIKIPIAIAVYQHVLRKNINLSTRIRVSLDFHTSGSGILRSLSDQVVLSIRDLVVLMLNMSDNTAANVLLSLVTRSCVNETLRELRIYNTQLGVDRIDVSLAVENPEIIGVTTPRDMTTLLCLLGRGLILNRSLCEDLLTIMRRDQNKQRICGLLPWRSDLVISHKTGTLAGVYHDVGLLRFSQGQYAISILSKHGRVVDDPRVLVPTDQVIAKLSRWIFDQVSTRSLA